ncbi:MAG: hypothetical protein WCT77_05040 [Bacteroidota bacterium]
METYKNKPLIIVFIAMIVLFLLFCGGALSVTISDGGMMMNASMMKNGVMTGNGWTSGISWMWIPAQLFLVLSILLAWVIFVKKKI